MKVIDKYGAALSAAIVDDEQYCIEELKAMLADIQGIEVVVETHDPMKAVPKILEAKPNLLLLDIQMPEKNGFEVIRGLKESGFEPSVIFVTAYDNYAIEAIKTAAFDYLLKPIEKQELQDSVNRFLQYHAHEKRAEKYASLLENVDFNRKIKLYNSGGFILMNLDDIVHIQADWNYAKVFTSKDKIETVTMNLGMLENMLPESGFMRINRSHIINLKYLTRVRRLARKCYLIKEGVEYEFRIPITRIRELEKRL